MSRQRPNKEASRNVSWNRSEAAINAGFDIDDHRAKPWAATTKAVSVGGLFPIGDDLVCQLYL